MVRRFLPGVPGREIENIFNSAVGNEISSGKFDSPESSAALAANAFGFFLKSASAYHPCPVARTKIGPLAVSIWKQRFVFRGWAADIRYWIAS